MGQPDTLRICGAHVFDGTGAPARHADVLVEGDRVVSVGALGGAKGGRELDASGLALAPGFIDVHTHDDFAALLHPDMQVVEAEEHLKHVERLYLSDSQHDIQALGEALGKWLLFTNPPVHSVSREVTVDLFSRFRLTDSIGEIVNTVMDAALVKKEIDPATDIASRRY